MGQADWNLTTAISPDRLRMIEYQIMARSPDRKTMIGYHVKIRSLWEYLFIGAIDLYLRFVGAGDITRSNFYFDVWKRV